jgi:hypothetical protein
MKNADTSNLLTLIDSADEHGRVSFYVRTNETVRNRAQAREYLLTIFIFNAVVTLRLERVKKAISEIDLVIASTPSGHTAVVVNLAKLLQLPGVAPAQELAAYRELVLDMRAFYEAHPTERCSIQVCNNRDHHRRVYGTIACRVPSKTDENRVEPDVEATKVLNARIEGNQALTHWLRQMALGLQTIGPWSWSIISEEHLFGYHAGPFAQHLLNRFRTEEANKQPPAPEQAPAPQQLVPLDI